MYSRLNPFPATLLENRLLSGAGSNKEIRHFVFELSGSGLAYRVGQSLGIYATNCPQQVKDLLSVGGFSGQEQVLLPKATQPVTLHQALTSELHLSWVTRKLLETLHLRAQDAQQKEKLTALLSPAQAEALPAYFEHKFPEDFLRQFPSARLSAQELVDSLKKLNPRLYSIASSSAVSPTRVSLAINIARRTASGRERLGACSCFLADRLKVGEKAPVFVAEAAFGLTPQDDAPIIMIGPGTGVAPFLGFLDERAHRQAVGKNWLFFGDQQSAHDFIYRDKMEAYQASGLLTRLDLAWSRDHAHKVYVQDLVEKNAAEVWQWLQQGAYLYICGDKQMGRGVEAVLQKVIAQGLQADEVAAAQYLSDLKKAGRFQKDTY